MSHPSSMTARLVKTIFLSLIGCLSCLLFWMTPLGQRTENLGYDALIRWRAGQEMGPVKEERLLIVAVDEKSRQAIEEPLALWVPKYGELLNGIFQSGVKVVGMDIIPTWAPVESLGPFNEAVMGVLNDEGEQRKLVMVSYFDTDTGTLVTPHQLLRVIVQNENLALSNLSRDGDGIFRRHHSSDIPLPSNNTLNRQRLPHFTTLLYERATGKKTPRDSFLINFVGEPGAVPRISFVDALNLVQEGRTAELKELFADKIVLIGGTARADLDFVETPFPSRSPMPGVEMHANILNTLLTQQWLEEKEQWLIFGLFLLPLAWTSLHRPVWQSTAALAVTSVLWYFWVCNQFSKGLFIHPSSVALVGLGTTYLVGYLYRYVTVERERKRIRNTFGRYVSKDVMEAMLEVPEDHKPELARSERVTVMFSDINDFSTACEKLEPEEVTRRLNIYFDEMTKIIYAHQGTIIRFIGDEFMVLFGAPKKNEKSEESATLAAVRMVERLEEMKSKDPTGENGFYEVKIGIHVGDMILTSIGNELRSDYNCIGDSTNMAARVLSLTKPLSATVLISEAVKEKVAEHPLLTLVDKGLHPVKGRAGEVRVFEASLKS